MTQASTHPFEAIFGLAPRIRYVAIYRDGQLDSREAPGLLGASSSESDKYEELIVNPTLMFLVQQRGNIDCGGAGYIVIGYGNFTQLVVAIRGGHASVAFEKGENPLEHVEAVRAIFEESVSLAA